MARPVGDLVDPGDGMAAERDAAATRHGQAPRLWPSLLLVIAFVVGGVLVSSVVFVRGHLLDPDVYSSALVEADAYDRVYTEVLADPELADITDHLLGDLGPESADARQVRTLATASLRLALPPSLLRGGTEAFLTHLLAYVRGDTPRLDGEIDVSDLPERIRAGATSWVQARLATADERVAPTVEGYRAAVAELTDTLAAGRMPRAVPVLAGASGGGAPAEATADVLLDRFGPALPAEAREQVRTAALVGDERGALVAVTGALIAAPVADAIADVRSELVDGRRLDVVAEVADHAARSRNTVVGHLNTVRDIARRLGPPTAVAGAVLMALAATGIAWRERRDPRRAGYLLAAAAGGWGLVILVGWVIAARVIDPPLAPATTTGPGTWNLPAGVRSVVADIESALTGELVGTVRRLALLPIAAGAALGGGIALASRLRLPSPRRAVAMGATAATVVGAVAWALPAAGASGSRACNGQPELCDRRYDEVVQAATHNAMASPEVVRVWPEQDGDIRAQLDAGVRALLIDTHHWDQLVSADQVASATELPLPPAVAADLFSRLGPEREARDGIFLCHNQCALGAVSFVDALASIREFLDESPDEVVTLVIQDAVSPDETAAAFAEAGLDGLVHHHELGTPWATLGELIDRGERLVVFAEAEGPPPTWYHQAFEHMQDTPYQFASVDDFDCSANRGDPDAPLLLVNHWVSRPNHAPDRATAARANAHDVLVERARACERERGHTANYLAVDFFNIGDVIAAVDTLNGVGAGTGDA
jgi:hypothetical protein